MDSEFQIEIQFNKHRVECPIDETLRTYLSKLKTKLDAIIEKDSDNVMVFNLSKTKLNLFLLHSAIWFLFSLLKQTVKTVCKRCSFLFC